MRCLLFVCLFVLSGFCFVLGLFFVSMPQVAFQRMAKVGTQRAYKQLECAGIL